MDEKQLLSALEDLSAIKKGFLAADNIQHSREVNYFLKSSYNITFVGLLLTFLLLILEITQPSFFMNYLQSLQTASNKLVGISILGASFVGLILTIFLQATWTVKKLNTTLVEFYKKNVQRFDMISFVFDLLFKYLVLVTVFYTGYYQLTPIFVLLFLADYLFKKDLFYLELKTSFLLGVLCSVLALVVFVYQLDRWSFLISIVMWTYVLCLSLFKQKRMLKD